MARKIAVELLKNNDDFYSVLIKVAYAIGKKEPVMLTADIVFKNEMESNIRTHFNLLQGQIRDVKDSQLLIKRFYPQNIIEELNLQFPQYQKLSQ